MIRMQRGAHCPIGRFDTMMRRMRGWMAAAMLVASVGCSHNQHPEDEPEFVPIPPIPVHVKNENFLDCNVFVVISGVSRRLGTVTGNGASDFTINYGLSSGQSLYLTAQ